jgi:hypothetical protein
VAATSLVARVRELLERAADDTLDSVELAAHAADLFELRDRLARLAARGLEGSAELAPEVDALIARLAPVAVAA